MAPGTGFVLTGTVGYPMPWISAAMLQFDPARQEFVADTVLPMYGVQFRQGLVPVIDREDWLRHVNTQMVDGAAYKRGVMRTHNVPFYCKKYGHEGPVTQEDQAFFAQVFDAELMAAKREKAIIDLDREYRVANLFFNTTTFATGYSNFYDASTLAPWGVQSTDIKSTLAARIIAFNKRTGLKPNALILNPTNMQNIVNNTTIRGRFPYNSVISKDMIVADFAKIIDPAIKKVVEAGAIMGTQAEGQVHSGSYVWSDNYVMLARIAETQDMTEPCIGRTLRWDAMDATGLEVYGYPEPQTDSQIIKVRQYLDEGPSGSTLPFVDSLFGDLIAVGPTATTTGA